MPPKADPIEIAIQKASDAMDADPTLKGTDAAKQFGAIYHRLMARRRGRPPSSTRGGHNQKLNKPQNHALIDYLTMLHYAGTSANLEILVLSANWLLFYSGVTDTVSQRWGKRWMIRHAEFLKTLKTKPIHAKRLAAYVVEDVNDHFTDFCRCRNY
jgi:hypothetical protein